ncbi:hypothetical protein [Lichenihabitans psoromatis]|uniref:hypothetical protein n=1 Tax=Lichenihabitans psoromatis TaxID=2528642 RepID=UPI0013F175A6|nr:hypothetical protein [Lichenihabitans psoromatis]
MNVGAKVATTRTCLDLAKRIAAGLDKQGNRGGLTPNCPSPLKLIKQGLFAEGDPCQ